MGYGWGMERRCFRGNGLFGLFILRKCFMLRVWLSDVAAGLGMLRWIGLVCSLVLQSVAIGSASWIASSSRHGPC